jgi:hypothetical protein
MSSASVGTSDLHHVADMGEQFATERSAGVGAGEIVGAEAARIEQGDGQRVTERQRCGRAGGGRQIQRAGFLVDAGVEVDVGFLCQRGGSRCR